MSRFVSFLPSSMFVLLLAACLSGCLGVDNDGIDESDDCDSSTTSSERISECECTSDQPGFNQMADACFWHQDSDADGFGNPDVERVSFEQPGGFVSNDSDCDDINSDVNPEATETCNSIDDDCDGEVDESGKRTFYADTDEDGFGDAESTVEDCEVPNGYVSNDSDCDDTNGSVNPNGQEVCNGIDDDCNDTIDDVANLPGWTQDADGDGYGNPDTLVQQCELPGGDYVQSDKVDDCDDDNSAVYPGATESCNEIDDDCDGKIDEGVQGIWYLDADRDSYGGSTSVPACEAPDGYTSDSTDCDDYSNTVYPGAPEHLDGIDNDCDGDVDDGTVAFDDDHDGFSEDEGDCDDAASAIYPGATELEDGLDNDCDGTVDEGTRAYDDDSDGYSENRGDCDDANSGVSPGTTETCNSVDDDCDGEVDEGVKSSFYHDADSDSYGNASSSIESCEAPANYVTNSSDCDDTNTATHPDALETCNYTDDNCDGTIDEGVKTAFYHDGDYDSYGDADDSVDDCEAPAGYVIDFSDCNDRSFTIRPGASELEDGLDNDCDGTVDEGTRAYDDDSDGYSENRGDCDDANSGVSPGTTETCNSVDDDCDGEVDEGVKSSFYHDADSDSYGSASSLIESCEAPANYVTNSSDCDDTNTATHPDALETCNDIDDDCDSVVDEGVTTAFFHDGDSDGYGAASDTIMACAVPIGFTTTASDCNDHSNTVHPGATEVVNSIDDDCDGTVDEGTVAYDDDSDGYSENAGDCNDTNPVVNPGAGEIENGMDDDCDGITDEGTDSYDDDGDGVTERGGDCDDTDLTVSSATRENCFDSEAVDNDCDGREDAEDLDCIDIVDNDGDGLSEVEGDCDDTRVNVHPDAPEIEDGLDNDCDGYTDEGTDGHDDDGDGYTEDEGDCNDSEADINPRATEVCDHADNNCNGAIDESPVCPWTDYDGDGTAEFADCDDANVNVHPGATEIANGIDDNCDSRIDEGTGRYDDDHDGYTEYTGDCDDTSSAIHPGITETCDGRDNDCDGATDEGLMGTYYHDSDSDRYGDPTDSIEACSASLYYVDNNDDCNDRNTDVNPDGTERCNGVDDDCNGLVDDAALGASWWYFDRDLDGYGVSTPVWSCEAPVDGDYTPDNGDCDDHDNDINPGADEACNDIDDDCDGFVDEFCP